MVEQHPLPALAEWQALELGLIAFPVESQHAVEQTWWQDLTGADANSTRKRFGRTDEGAFQGRAFMLEIDP